MKRFYNKYGLWIMFFASAILLSASIILFAKRNKWLDEEFAYRLSLHHISDKLATVNLLVKNAESGVRGYAATGNREFVTGFEKNINDLKEETRLLITEKEKKGIEPFSQMLFTLDSLVEKRIALLQEVKALAETNQPEAVQFIRVGPGLKLSNSISHSIDLLDAEVDRKINTSQKAFLYTNRRNNIYAYISLTGSLLFILFSFYLLFKEINWRKKISKELKFQKERFRTTLNSIHDGLISTDTEGHIIFMNPSAERLTGWSWKEAKNQPLQKIYNVVNEETGAGIDGLLDSILKEGKTSEWENNTILQSKFNEKFVISKSAAPVLNENGKVEGAVVVFNDITEKKKLENKIRENELLLRSIIQAEPECVKLLGINGELQEMNRAGLAMIEADDLQQVIGASVYGIVCEPYRQEFIRLTQDVFAGNSGMQEFEIVGLKGTRRWLETHAVPLKNSDGIIVSLLGITRDITERKKVENEIEKSREKYISLIQTIQGIVWEADAENFQFTYISPYAEKLLGYPASHWTDIKGFWADHIHPDDRTWAVNYCYECTMNKMNHEFEYRIIAADGRIVWIRDLVTVITENNKPAILRGVMVDITEHKIAEEKTIVSEHKLQQTLDNMLEGALIIDFNERLIYLNNLALETSQYRKEDLIGHQLKDKYPGIENTKVYATIKKCLEERVPQYLETDFTLPGGKLSWFQLNIQPVEEGVFILFLEITERKNAENKIGEVLKRYEILSRATSDTIWDWDMVNNTMLYNEGITNMFGYQSSDVKNVTDWWNDKLHKDDFGKVAASLNEIFENKQKYFQLTYRFRCADGSYKYIFDRAFVLFDDDGTPYRMIGSMQDISYRKEEEVRIGRAAIEAQERERLQIGMELHDNVKQILSATLLYLGMANDKNRSKKEVAEYIEMCHGFILDSIKEIRQLSHRLAPSSFENISMKEVIDLLIQNMNPENQWKVKLHTDEKDLDGISNDLKVNLYRILQEQLSNIVKYADAGKVEVEIEIADNNILLRILDNGKGFDPATVKSGIGLENIRRRTEVFSGELFINSSVGKGCELIVRLPLKSGGS